MLNPTCEVQGDFRRIEPAEMRRLQRRPHRGEVPSLRVDGNLSKEEGAYERGGVLPVWGSRSSGETLQGGCQVLGLRRAALACSPRHPDAAEG